MPKLRTADDLADFRDRLCDAAETMFAEHGPEAVTIRQLAHALGVSPMTPYGYFKDKDAILAAVRARAFNRHADALEAAFRAAPNEPAARSRAVGEAYVRFAFEHPQAYKLMFDINQPDADDYPGFAEATARSRATMTAHLDGLVAGKGANSATEIVGHLFWAALHGPLMLRFSGMVATDELALRMIEDLTTAVGRAYVPHSG